MFHINCITAVYICVHYFLFENVLFEHFVYSFSVLSYKVFFLERNAEVHFFSISLQKKPLCPVFRLKNNNLNNPDQLTKIILIVIVAGIEQPYTAL